MKKKKIFKKRVSTLLLITAIIFSSFLIPSKVFASNVIVFSDKNLEAVIRAQINKPYGDILDTDVAAITSLNAANKGISSIEGIQNLKGLKMAVLSNNQISNINCLGTLTGLTILDLGNNKVVNIEAIRSLVNLRFLTLDNNRPESFEPITGLPLLKVLGLNNTGLVDPGIINRLSAPISLTSLSLSGNSIVDISSLTNCINLTVLNLGNNKISDLSQIGRFTKLKTLTLNDNIISDVSPVKDIAGLTTLNIENNRILSVISLRNLLSLSQLVAGGNQININDLSGFPSLTTLQVNNSNISDISVLSGLKITDLKLDYNRISDLSPLTGKTMLKSLSLKGNQISDPSPLKSLTGLNSLDLSNNLISDISSLSSLSLLSSLYIDNNKVTDIGVLNSIPGLVYVGIGGNPIGNVQKITLNNTITDLVLDNLGLVDISFLKNMPQLKSISLNGNPVGDFQIVGSLSNLQGIAINNTGIKDLTVLSALPNIIALELKNNGITDIRPLKSLPNLIYLYLSGNRITDYRPIADVYNRLLYKDFEFEILQVLGCLEVPGEGYAIGGTINMSGYLLDPEGVAKIEVFVDGIKSGDAVYGDLRQDISQLYPKYYNSNSGFHYTLNTGTLTAGNHIVTIRETSAYGTVNTLPAKNISVSRLIPRGCLDKPASGETLAGSYNVRGWFLDPSSVEKIEAIVDGVVMGSAVYGDPRQDVYNVYPAYNNTYSGFHYTLDTLKLSEGAHTITVRETGLNGVKTTLSAKTIYISRLMPIGVIDKPSNGQTITSVFKVYGWFLDTSGVDKIEVLVDGAVKGTAAYGLPRKDVSLVYPQYNNSMCGYEYYLDTNTLTTGKHTISIREKGKNGATTSLVAKTFYVIR